MFVSVLDNKWTCTSAPTTWVLSGVIDRLAPMLVQVLSETLSKCSMEQQESAQLAVLGWQAQFPFRYR